MLLHSHRPVYTGIDDFSPALFFIVVVGVVLIFLFALSSAPSLAEFFMHWQLLMSRMFYVSLKFSIELSLLSLEKAEAEKSNHVELKPIRERKNRKENQNGKVFVWHTRHKEPNLLRRWRITSGCAGTRLWNVKNKLTIHLQLCDRTSAVYCHSNRQH